MRLALAFGLGGLDVPTIALAGFLVRGGLVLLLLPSVVLPSVIGIAGATGVHAFTLSGTWCGTCRTDWRLTTIRVRWSGRWTASWATPITRPKWVSTHAAAK